MSDSRRKRRSDTVKMRPSTWASVISERSLNKSKLLTYEEMNQGVLTILEPMKGLTDGVHSRGEVSLNLAGRSWRSRR
jgi:hypothetical protein